MDVARAGRMSTKIYNGFRFKDTDLLAVYKLVMEWRLELMPLHERAVHRFIAEIACNLVDDESISPSSTEGTAPLLKGMSILWKMQEDVRKTLRRNPAVDFDFSLSILPHDGRVYGIVFTEQQDWLRLWMARPVARSGTRSFPAPSPPPRRRHPGDVRSPRRLHGIRLS